MPQYYHQTLRRILQLLLLLIILCPATPHASIKYEFWPIKSSSSPVVVSGGSAAAAVNGNTYTDPLTGMEFVWVKGGCFDMGSQASETGRFANEGPVHKVCVDGFYMGKYEVTQQQWRAIMGNNPSRFKGDNRPVENVSWNDAQKYINKLKGKTGKHYRLPTEAEWEYAARGGQQYTYAGSNDVDAVAWYSANSGNKTHDVGQKRANGYGLYDMSGNVWELCQDWYASDYYRNSPRTNPPGPSTGSNRVNRGGSCYNDPRYVRSADRNSNSPGNRDDSLGFRLVLLSSGR